MLRERPDISPWSLSGNADCTTFTDIVSMMPIPAPVTRSPGRKARMFVVNRDKSNSKRVPAMVVIKPDTMRNFRDRRLASLPATLDVTSSPMVAGTRITPVSMAL